MERESVGSFCFLSDKLSGNHQGCHHRCVKEISTDGFHPWFTFHCFHSHSVVGWKVKQDDDLAKNFWTDLHRVSDFDYTFK